MGHISYYPQNRFYSIISSSNELIESFYSWKDVGYELVHIDDCWPLKKRNEKNELVPDPVRFPNGMKEMSFQRLLNLDTQLWLNRKALEVSFAFQVCRVRKIFCLSVNKSE